MKTFHTRRLSLPQQGGWIEIQGSFDMFELSSQQMQLIAMMADWFLQFERTFAKDELAGFEWAGVL
jgi:hypothetical protein